MKRPTKFNPDKFRAELAQLNPNDAIDVATHWRTKANTIKNEMTEATESALEIGITGLTAFGLSYLAGGWQVEKAAEVKKWNEGGAVAAGKSNVVNGVETTSPFVEGGKEDPTEMFGIDKTLWATIVLGGAAVFKLGGKKYNNFLRSGALGAMAVWAGGLGRELGAEAAAAAATAAQQGQT